MPIILTESQQTKLERLAKEVQGDTPENFDHEDFMSRMVEISEELDALGTDVPTVLTEQFGVNFDEE